MSKIGCRKFQLQISWCDFKNFVVLWFVPHRFWSFVMGFHKCCKKCKYSRLSLTNPTSEAQQVCTQIGLSNEQHCGSCFLTLWILSCSNLVPNPETLQKPAEYKRTVHQNVVMQRSVRSSTHNDWLLPGKLWNQWRPESEPKGNWSYSVLSNLCLYVSSIDYS